MTLKRKRILIILLVIITPLSIFLGFRLIKGYVAMPYSKIYSVLKDDRKCEALFTDENGKYSQYSTTVKPGFLSRNTRDLNTGDSSINLAGISYNIIFVQANLTTKDVSSEYGDYKNQQLYIGVGHKLRNGEKIFDFSVHYNDLFMTYEIEKYEGYDEEVYQQLKASWENKVSQC